MTIPQKVKLVEVGPRDGLQNESQSVSVEQRVELINLLSLTGLSHIEAGSFVSPEWAPKMAGTADVLAAVEKKASIHLSVLTPNQRGYDDAVAAGANEIAVFATASETFSRKNTNCSITESIQRFRPICADAISRGIRVRGYISCVIDCPYEGKIDASRVAQLATELHDCGCDEISLGDTIGTGTPGHVKELIAKTTVNVPIEKLAVHFHDTYGQGLANILTSLQMGISVLDSAVAGLGGCPYAKGATGNVATEDVLYMLDGMGIETGVSMERLLNASSYICTVLNREPISRAGRALLHKRA